MASCTRFKPPPIACRFSPVDTLAGKRFSAYTEQVYASKNFFYAHINKDDARVTASNQIPCKAAEDKPWLYDRVSAFYSLYFLSGFFKALRESVRASQYYRVNLHPQGTTPDSAVDTFRLKNPNPAAYIGVNGAKYSYPGGLAYTYWSTGDDLAKDGARLAAKAQQDANDEPDRWSSSSSYTERHIGIKLMGLVVAYELFGNVPYKIGHSDLSRTGAHARRQSDLAPERRRRRTAGQSCRQWPVEVRRAGRQRPSGSLLVNFWQTPFVIGPMVRAYLVTDNVQVARFIRRTGNALKFGAKSYPPSQRTYYTSAPENLRLVDCVTLIDGSTCAADGIGPEHTLSVAGAMAWAYYFSKITQGYRPAAGRYPQAGGERAVSHLRL